MSRLNFILIFYHFYVVVMIEEGSTVQISQFACWVFAFDSGVIYCSVLCVISSFTMDPLWRRELII